MGMWEDFIGSPAGGLYGSDLVDAPRDFSSYIYGSDAVDNSFYNPTSSLYGPTASESAIDSGLYAKGLSIANKPTILDLLSGALSKAPGALESGARKLLGEGSTDIPSYLQNNAGSLTALMGLYALMGGNKPKTAGYSGSIPKLTATRERLPQQEGRRPGGPAGAYFTPVQYRASGGYLRGATGGMADELDTTIDDKQAAKLSHGEFVVPADVVSHLGDGNSEAGAKKLYQMMDRVRQARTGKKQQAPEIEADKFMPKNKQSGTAKFAVGGSVGATGSEVSATGGLPNVGMTGTSTVSNLAPWVGDYVTGMLGKAQALSNMPYQPYTEALTPGTSPLQAQAFQGLAGLTTPAGIGAAEQRTSQLGQQLGGINYAPTQFGSQTFTPQAAQQYMNPYLQGALEPQLAEARRQADIQRVQDAGRLTKAGAFGGTRQAIMESEGARNLGQRLSDITGQGYSTAYQQAAAQFEADQRRKAAAETATEQSRQYGAGFGLQGLQQALAAAQQQGSLANVGRQAGLQNIEAQLQGGTAQRGIESEGLAADYKRFQEERDYPLKMAQYQQSFLQQLPITATSYQEDLSPIDELAGSGLGLMGIYELLAGMGKAK